MDLLVYECVKGIKHGLIYHVYIMFQCWQVVDKHVKVGVAMKIYHTCHTSTLTLLNNRLSTERQCSGTLPSYLRKAASGNDFKS